MPHLPERKAVKYDWKTLTDYRRDELNTSSLWCSYFVSMVGK